MFQRMPSLVLVEEVVVAALVLGILEHLPGAVGLLLVRRAAHRLGRVVVLHEHVEGVAGIDRLQDRLGGALLEVRAADDSTASAWPWPRRGRPRRARRLARSPPWEAISVSAA
jgi:hypothetical protein